MLKDFKAFLLRGNVVDLAVAVVIGAAFNSVVQSIVSSFINPLITLLFSVIGGKPDFDQLTASLNKVEFPYGVFVNAVVSFLIIAAVVFFFVVRPVNDLIARANRRDKPVADEPAAKDPQLVLLEEIRDLLKADAVKGGKR